jgi:hypothetical protein
VEKLAAIVARLLKWQIYTMAGYPPLLHQISKVGGDVLTTEILDPGELNSSIWSATQGI